MFSIPTLLESMSVINFTHGCGYSRTGAIHNFFRDWKAASAFGDHGKVHVFFYELGQWLCDVNESQPW
jgi:hypothetical protein